MKETTPSASTGETSIQRFRVVLLDDNADDRAHFRNLLRRHPALDLVGEADTFKSALELIATKQADVLFLESEIAGSRILEECSLVPSSVRLVFLTKNAADALQAFEMDALDFLLKPLAAARLSETIRRMLRIEWTRPTPTPSTQNKLLIPFERGRRGASLDEIAVIQAFGNYTRVALASGGSEIVLRSLAKWEKLLPMPPFLRVHRNTLVHSAMVKGLEETAQGTALRMDNIEELVPVSRRCLSEVRHLLFGEKA